MHQPCHSGIFCYMKNHHPHHKIITIIISHQLKHQEQKCDDKSDTTSTTRVPKCECSPRYLPVIPIAANPTHCSVPGTWYPATNSNNLLSFSSPIHLRCTSNCTWYQVPGTHPSMNFSSYWYLDFLQMNCLPCLELVIHVVVSISIFCFFH